MNVALIGSVSSSFYALETLIREGIEITAVLGLDESCAPGVSDYRSLRPLAQKTSIPFQPFVKVTEPQVTTFLEEHRPDVLWVIGLSQLVPHRLIEIARDGGVGFHPTMLPRGRGRAPVAWTIILNEPAAVSLFHLAEEPDAGDILVQRQVPVLPDDYSEDLIVRTNEVLSDVIAELAPDIKIGNLPRQLQDHRQATYYAKRTANDGLIHWSQPTDRIYRLIRAVGAPYPGAFSFLNGDQVTIRRAKPAMVGEEVVPNGALREVGMILHVDDVHGTLVRTLDGGLWLTETKGVDPSNLKPGARFISRTTRVGE